MLAMNSTKWKENFRLSMSGNGTLRELMSLVSRLLGRLSGETVEKGLVPTSLLFFASGSLLRDIRPSSRSILCSDLASDLTWLTRGTPSPSLSMDVRFLNRTFPSSNPSCDISAYLAFDLLGSLSFSCS